MISTGDLQCTPCPAEGVAKENHALETTDTKEASSPQVDKEDMAWICAECKEAECGLVGDGEDSDKFLICDGPCKKVFHIPCAGLTMAPTGDDDWFCQDCARKEHACAYCSEYGQDYVDVFPCKDDQCGLFFHEACLKLHHVDYKYALGPTTKSPTANAVSSDDDDDDDEQDQQPKIPIFSCHAHQCWTCTQKDMIQLEKDERALLQKTNNKKSKASRKKRKKNTSIFQCKPGRLYRCLYCPRAYHITCIPLTAKFHELAVLCHEHALTHKLPELDMNESMQSRVESKIDEALMRMHGISRSRSKKEKQDAWTRMYGKRGLSTNPFLPGLRGDKFDETERGLLTYIKDTALQQQQEREDDDNAPAISSNSTMSMLLDGNIPFCLPADIKDEVYSKPPSYSHIQSNKFGDSNDRPKKVQLQEHEKCKCTGSCGDDCFNRITMAECTNTNCNLGSKDCGNRALGKRQFVKCQPKRERGKGWGLVTLENIPRNKLVQEYVGEVINEKEKENRLKLWSKEHPYDPNFYIMALSGGYYVDARVFANQSRFINHSCAPNCKVVSINVKGRIRNGIYSIRDIKAGEFLCYDYHFDTKQGDYFSCRCGAPNCRGTMQGGKRGESSTKKASTWKEIRAQYEADKVFLKEIEGTDVITFKNGPLPGTENENEVVARGPLWKHRKVAIANKLFLWRNVEKGKNFESRHARLRRIGASTSNEYLSLESPSKRSKVE